jgi:hypothetical protein
MNNPFIKVDEGLAATVERRLLYNISFFLKKRLFVTLQKKKKKKKKKISHVVVDNAIVWVIFKSINVWIFINLLLVISFALFLAA